MTLETRLHNLKLWFGEYWTWWITLNVCSFLILYAYGCEPKTTSLISVDKKVTRAELQIEIDSLLNTSRIRIADLDRQAQIRDLVFQQALIIAEGGGINPIGVLTGLLAVLGVGATADDLRLRRQRKNQPVIDKTDTR